MQSGFPRAQSANNVLESALNIAYLALARRQDPMAVLVGFAALVATFSKTVLSVGRTRAQPEFRSYALNEHFSGYVGVGHNKLPQLILLYLLPNGAWLVVPSIVRRANRSL